MVRSSLPNFILISATCRPCRAKKPKIGQRVKTIPAELPFGQILPVNISNIFYILLKFLLAMMQFNANLS